MSEFKYLKADRAYNELFYQYPKVFIEGPQYKKLSEGAKIAYMLLKARSDYAIYKNQIDAEGNIYFEFTGKELADMMNCSERRVTSLKKELEQFGLLLQVKMGFNKLTGKNAKNRLYLAELEVTEHDIYSMQQRDYQGKTLENSGLADFASQSPAPAMTQNASVEGFVDVKNLSKIAESPDNSGLENFAKEFNNLKADTNKSDTLEKETSKEQQLDLELLATFHLTNDQSFLSERSLQFIGLYAKSFKQADEQVAILYRAKKKAEKDKGKLLVADEWQEDIDLRLRKAVQKIRTDHTIKNPDNYLFKTFYHFFCDRISEEISWHSAKELPKIQLMEL